MSERKQLLEEWPGPWMLWARKFCRKNLWRIEKNVGTSEDALAECALIYCQCRKRYGGVVANGRHFMRLYQLSVITAFHDHSNKATKRVILQDEVDMWKPRTIVSEGMVVVKLRGASPELQQVVSVLTSAPPDVLRGILGDARLTPDKMLARVGTYCGFQHTAGLAKELYAVLT